MIARHIRIYCVIIVALCLGWEALIRYQSSRRLQGWQQTQQKPLDTMENATSAPTSTPPLRFDDMETLTKTLGAPAEDQRAAKSPTTFAGTQP